MDTGGTRDVKKWAALSLLLPLFAGLCVSAALAQDQPVKEEQKEISAQGMALGDFVNMLSQAHKLNIVAPKDMTGTVSVHFYDVPVLDALRAVLEANGYEYEIEKTQDKPLIKIKKIQVVEGTVAVVMRPVLLNYATASDIAKAIEKLLTKNGSVTIASGRNAVIVQDVAEAIQRVDEVVKLMDAAPRQVMIDAKIVELGKTDIEKTGFNWSMFQNLKIADITAEVSFARAATWTSSQITGTGTTWERNIVETTGNNINLRAGILAENNAQLVLDFFDTLTNTTIISRPSIRTLDNKAAHIISGQIVPIPLFDFAKDTGVRTLSGFQDEQIGVELTVTPHINEDGGITLDINPKVESIDRYITVGGDEQRPVKNTRQATTTVRIKDGNTAVIGGLTSSSIVTTTTGLPWFKDLPWIGFIFRNKTNNVIDTELVIFITARTVDDRTSEPLSDGQKQLLKQVDDSRIVK